MKPRLLTFRVLMGLVSGVQDQVRDRAVSDIVRECNERLDIVIINITIIKKEFHDRIVSSYRAGELFY